MKIVKEQVYLDLSDVIDGHKLDNGEILYVCPYCRDYRHKGESYSKRKLYYNPRKKVGHCFVCNAILVGDDSFDKNDINTDSFEMFANSNTTQYSLNSKLSQYKNQKFNIGMLKDAKLIPESYEYLKNNRNLSDEIINNFIFKDFNLGNDRGILIGSNVISDGIVDFYQVRNLNKLAIPKYISPPNSLKNIGYINYLSEGDNAIICEGFFSALSASQHLNYKYKPLVLFGKVITEFQLKMLNDKLKDTYIEELVCCLDGGYSEENKELFKKLKNNNYISKVTYITLPDDKDPNDLDKDTFKQFFEKRSDTIFDISFK